MNENARLTWWFPDRAAKCGLFLGDERARSLRKTKTGRRGGIPIARKRDVVGCDESWGRSAEPNSTFLAADTEYIDDDHKLRLENYWKYFRSITDYDSRFDRWDLINKITARKSKKMCHTFASATCTPKTEDVNREDETNNYVGSDLKNRGELQ